MIDLETRHTTPHSQDCLRRRQLTNACQRCQILWMEKRGELNSSLLQVKYSQLSICVSDIVKIISETELLLQ